MEDNQGTIIRFDLEVARYVRVWSSISSDNTTVHFAEIVAGLVNICRHMYISRLWFLPPNSSEPIRHDARVISKEVARLIVTSNLHYTCDKFAAPFEVNAPSCWAIMQIV